MTERRRAQAILAEQHSFLEQRVSERTRELEQANALLRKRVEETRTARAAAQASEARFRAIFDGAYELIGLLAPDGRLLEPNRAALLFAGVSAESVRGMLFWETAFGRIRPSFSDITEAISPRMHDHLHEIEEASRSATALTTQLLAFARRQIAEPRVLDLNGSVSSVQKLQSRLLGEDVRLVLELEPDLWRVRVDPSHAQQMLMNLAVNARDAMPKGGRLLLRTENCVAGPPEHLGLPLAAEYVVLSISDEGVGMSADTMSQIFEPFFTTKPLGMGTGLGLAMVYGAMQQALGCVDVHSVVRRGSTFRLYFPCCSEAANDDAADLLDSKPPRCSESVALVEDQDLVRGTTKRQLESLGYRVLTFASAAEALPTLLSDHKLSLLITDLVLPGVSGRELAEELSRSRPRLSVLFISGYTEDVVLRHGIEVGAVQFLAKPFNVAELDGAVRRALDGKAERAQGGYAPIDSLSS